MVNILIHSVNFSSVKSLLALLQISQQVTTLVLIYPLDEFILSNPLCTY